MQRSIWLAVAVLAAGCATPAPIEAVEEDDFGVVATEDTGIIRGVVVDETITPVDGVAVTLGAGDMVTATDAEGRFAFGAVQPGFYPLSFSHPLYADAQVQVEVVAGRDDAPVTKVQLTRLFSADPYLEQWYFQGYIQCGYELPVITSQCVNDYTTIVVGGGVANELRTIAGDDRGYESEVGPGWQSMIYELAWEPSAQGTSERMGLLVSFFERTSTDRFASVSSDPPSVYIRLDVGVEHETANGDPAMVAPEGRDDLYQFVTIQAAQGSSVGFGAGQEFEVFQNNFYYGVPPEGWSFLAGDGPPF